MGEYNGKIYPPYQCADFLRCPVLWALKEEGWQSKTYGYAEIAGALGTGIAEAQEYWYGKQRDIDTAINVGQYAVVREFARLHHMGRRCEGMARKTRDMVPRRLSKYLKHYFNADPLTACRIVGVEVKMVKARGRIDLVVEDGPDLVIVDHKSKLTMKKAYLLQTYKEYAQSWQLKHYLHFYRDAAGRQATHAEIVLGVIEPKPSITRWRFVRDDISLAAWYQSAIEVWTLMSRIEEGEIRAWQTATHTAFGAMCSFHRACFTHYYDEGLMESDYVNTKKGKNEKTI
jgi:hypothetical protein